MPEIRGGEMNNRAQDDDEDFFDPDAECSVCRGEGYVWGDELYNPLWYNVDKLYECRCCGGSGLARNMSYFQW